METFQHVIDAREDKSSLLSAKWTVEEDDFLHQPPQSHWANRKRQKSVSQYVPYNFHLLPQLITIETIHGKTVSLPETYQTWADAIKKSKYILDYVDVNADTGEEATYCHKTWARTVDVLIGLARDADQDGKRLPAPAIFDGYEGSIDVHWDTPQMKMLVNVPKSLSEPISYYGEDQKGQFSKGKFYGSDDVKIKGLGKSNRVF